MNIIPNWHTLLVHFTVALLSVSAVLFTVGYFIQNQSRKAQLHLVAEWNFWIGSGLAILTLLAGWYAYNTVAHDTASHIAMTVHRNWALTSAGLLMGLNVWLGYLKKSSQPINAGFVIAALALWGLLVTTAWHGGEIVYRHGLGVMSLPQTDDHSNGGGGHQQETEHEDSNMVQVHPKHDHNQQDAANIVHAFQQAIQAGDAQKARALMGDTVLIFESGSVERSADEYAADHMQADMAFLKNMSITPLEHHVQRLGDMAVSASRLRIHGHYKGKPVDFESMETMALQKIEGAWRITHIHWSK